MGKIIKGVILYIMLIGIVLVVLGGGAIGIMFLTANTNSPLSVFGYKAIYKSGVITDNVVYEFSETMQNKHIIVNVDSGEFDVNINQYNDDTYRLNVTKFDKIYGITKGEYDPKLVTSFAKTEGEEDVYEFNIKANIPNGIATYGNSNINIMLPFDENLTYELNLTSKNGDIVIDGAKNSETDGYINVTGLSVNTNRGDLTVKNINSKIVSDSNDVVTLNKLNLTTNGGTFDFSKIDTLKLYSDVNTVNNVLHAINIEATSGKFTFNDLVGPINFHGDSIYLVAKNVKTEGYNFVYNSPSGYFKIDEINTAGGTSEIITENASIEILKLISTMASDNNNNGAESGANITTTYGSVTIGELHNYSIIKSTHGNINLNEVFNGVHATSSHGKIILGSYLKAVTLINDKGIINATYKSTGDSAEAANHKTTIKTKNGDVKLNGIINALDVNISGSANINITFREVVEERDVVHNIVMGTGKATINVKGDLAFNVKAKGNVYGVVESVNISQSLNLVTADADGYKSIQVLVDNGKTISMFVLNANRGKIEFKTIN